MKKVIDGNTLCGKIAYFLSELCFVYPITPSSPGASEINRLNEIKSKNLFNRVTKTYEMQSEAGVAGAMHGALMDGTLCSTFTSSQGLLLMIPNLYKMAGESLPGVIHVASRTVATNALSIFGDHSDIYACNNTGVCILSSANLEDIKYLGLIAHLASIKGSLPFIHFYDGFRTSHEYNVTNLLEDKELLELIDFNKIKEFKKHALSQNKFQRGMSVNEDIYFQTLEAKNNDYQNMVKIVDDYMKMINQKYQTNYEPFSYYGAKNPKHLIIAMGSVTDTIKEVIDYENSLGKEYGLITVYLYRPFSKEYLLKVIPDSVKTIAVLDRAKTAGSREPLFLDVASCLIGKDIKLIGGRYGLSSKNTTPAQIKAVFNNLENDLLDNFTIGILDDVTNLSLTIPDYQLNTNNQEIKLYGYGSDGLVTCSKDLLKIIGENSAKFVNGYFEYDSKKSGGLTIGHLRIGDQKINEPYYVDHISLVVISDENYLLNKVLFDNVLPNSNVLINTSKNINDLIYNEANGNKINELALNIYTIDANKIAAEANIPGKISMIMEACILKLLDLESLMPILEDNIKKRFSDKGSDVVNNNLSAIKHAIVKKQEVNIRNIIRINNDLFYRLINHQSNDLKVSEVYDYKDGIYPGGKASLVLSNKSLVPVWNKDKCSGCMKCSIVCPFGVLRPVINDEEGIPKKDQYLRITVNEDLCTSCGLCVKACNFEALTMGNKTNQEKYFVDKYFNQGKCSDNTILDLQTGPYPFQYPSACAGCGEVNYLKLMGQLLQDKMVVANATGCSSIYGGSAPVTPYNVPWANSLFEDNAEFGIGIKRSLDLKKQYVLDLIEASIESVSEETKKLYEEYLANQDNYDIIKNVIDSIKDLDIPKELKDNLNYLLPKTVVIAGGDGWAYDIGFNGIDQALSSNLDINILVLDTEGYSNTGGQASKASPQAASLEFQNLGKKNPKKDLFKIAISYPNVYVAETSYLANPMHTFKVFKEAINHKGPSIIICYATCIEHGINCGLSSSIEEQKLLIDSGYEILMHYDNKLIIDSKEPDFTKLDQVFDREVRYKKLKNKNKDIYDELVSLNKEAIINRYNYYKELGSNE
ncbi:MAG: pyruvate:ferredoxin (flavodoxin) oxidoreductase [Bacilli bacterium]|nr:pyruvate:ferredoxin (flavodoxin) oxidoreductase [Bacilli bacterium]